MGRKFVSWRRVSTGKQSRSGLGLEAQKSIIEYFVNYEHGELIADYEECHTGTSLLTCTELKKAMEHCKREDACLIIAKVDRFRTVIEALQILDYMGEGNVMFCDLPTSDRFSLTLYTALAEREALLVSIRTKQALQALKNRGDIKLGAANEKYQKSLTNKTKEEKERTQIKKGKQNNKRFLMSRDVQAFLRIIKNIFPDACSDDDAGNWKWKQVTTRGDNKRRIHSLMRDYREMDTEGTLFVKWHIDEWKDSRVQSRICSILTSVRRALKTEQWYKEREDKE